jgi:hypothetical protein
MSIFGTIRDAIFGHKTPSPAATPAAAPGSSSSPSPDSVSTASVAPSTAAVQQGAASVDVAAVLSELATKAGQPLNWRTSIVDLMKLLGLDSSLAQRRALAAELGFSGDTNDTATMNVWLHQQVMKKLAENGGKVPPELLH